MDAQVNSLRHFQQHSRLHFIGQWKTKSEAHLRQLYEDHPEWNHGLLAEQKTFVHVDMDSYFCSVALSKDENAQYRNCPVAIAAGKNNSDVSSCNYVARKFGVHAGMWVGEAKAICPELVVLGYDLARCEVLNVAVYRALLSSIPTNIKASLEVYSVDEVVVALDTDDQVAIEAYCVALREEISRVTNGCTASCGIGPSILVARLATARAKPDGIFAISRSEVAEFIETTRAKDVHGVGRATLHKLLPLLTSKFPELRVQVAGDTPSSLARPAPRHPGLARKADGSVTEEKPYSAAVAAALVPAQLPEESVHEMTGGGNKERPGDHVSQSDNDGSSKSSLDGGHGDTSDSDADEPAVGPDQRQQQAATTISSPSASPSRIGVLCRHLQGLSLPQMQQALGRKAGEQLFHFCRGQDTRQVRRTGDLENQGLLGKQLPNAVGCSMNYAVRPVTADDVFDIIRQIIGDVSAKLRRLHACASGARLIILERHPDYPKTTTKFMGTGRCVEHPIKVVLRRALTGEQEAEMLDACVESCSGWLTPSSEIKAREVASKILLEDIRGITLQLTGLQAVMRRADTSSEMLPRIKRVIGSGSTTGQVSLTAAFRSVRERKRQRAPSTVDLGSDGSGSDSNVCNTTVDGSAVEVVERPVTTLLSSSSSSCSSTKSASRGEPCDEAEAEEVPENHRCQWGAASSVADGVGAEYRVDMLFESLERMRCASHRAGPLSVDDAKSLLEACCIQYGDVATAAAALRLVALWAVRDITTLETFASLHNFVGERFGQQLHACGCVATARPLRLAL